MHLLATSLSFPPPPEATAHPKTLLQELSLPPLAMDTEPRHTMEQEPHRRGASAERLALGKGPTAPAPYSSEAFEHLVTTPVKREPRGAARSSSLNAPGVRTFSAGGEAAYVPFAAGAQSCLSLLFHFRPTRLHKAQRLAAAAERVD